MIKDPFHVAAEFTVKPSRLADALARVVPQAAGGKVMVCNRASRKMNVLDSTSDGVCCACKKAVWMSPSSRRTAPPYFIVCMTCLEKADRDA